MVIQAADYLSMGSHSVYCNSTLICLNTLHLPNSDFLSEINAREKHYPTYPIGSPILTTHEISPFRLVPCRNQSHKSKYLVFQLYIKIAFRLRIHTSAAYFIPKHER